MCMGGGNSSAPAVDYAGQKAAADAEAARVKAEADKAKQADDAKMLVAQQTQANNDAAAAAKRRLLISQSLDDKGQALESTDPAVRLDGQTEVDTATDDPLGLAKKKKSLLSNY